MFCVNAVNRCSAALMRSENGSTVVVVVVFVVCVVEYEWVCSRILGVPGVVAEEVEEVEVFEREAEESVEECWWWRCDAGVVSEAVSVVIFFVGLFVVRVRGEVRRGG